MYVNLDVLVRLGQIALIIAGVAVLIYLCLLFKSVIETMKNLQKTLDAATRDLEKLESPLSTVDSISNTVDELSVHAKQTAVTALSAMNSGAESLKGYFSKKDKAETKPAGKTESVSEVVVSLNGQDHETRSSSMSDSNTNINGLPEQAAPGAVTPAREAMIEKDAAETNAGVSVFENIEKIDQETFEDDKK